MSLSHGYTSPRRGGGWPAGAGGRNGPAPGAGATPRSAPAVSSRPPSASPLDISRRVPHPPPRTGRAQPTPWLRNPSSVTPPAHRYYPLPPPALVRRRCRVYWGRAGGGHRLHRPRGQVPVGVGAGNTGCADKGGDASTLGRAGAPSTPASTGSTVEGRPADVFREVHRGARVTVTR